MTTDWCPGVWPGVATRWTPSTISSSPSTSRSRSRGTAAHSAIVYRDRCASACSAVWTKRGVDQPLLAAMVEVKMGEHDRGDVADLEMHRRQSVPECHDLRAVPVVDDEVALADPGVDEDHTVGVPDRPGVDRERFERAVLGVPFGHPGHAREGQPFDDRQLGQRHGTHRTVDRVDGSWLTALRSIVRWLRWSDGWAGTAVKQPSRGDVGAADCRVDVLGPVRITVNGIERSITARRQRALLACLALHAGEAVSADRLLDDIWGDEQPDSGVRAVAYQVSKLRSSLQPDRTDEGSLITTTPAGYVLHVESDHVDVNEFDRLVDLARDALSTDPAACQTLMERAFASGEDARMPISATKPSSRSSPAVSRRVTFGAATFAESRIAQGHHADVIGDLEAMAAEHPFEEASCNS